MRYYAGLAERWDIICRCVEVRARSLRQIHQLWTEADTERDRLASWLAGVERMLRNARDSIHLERREIITVRGQSYVSRLPKY
jgi:hypothetical protein